MKKTTVCYISAILIAATIFTVLTGCGNDSVSLQDGKEERILTLATLGLSTAMRDTVTEFNRNNPDCRIEITDYSQFNTDDDSNAGITRFNTEIIAGKYPDIIDTSSIPYTGYADSGLLADLYPFIDADPDFSRDDFIREALQAVEIDGRLYQVFAGFTINTVIGNPSVIGLEPGWNMDEFMAVVNAYPDADVPGGWWMTKTVFITWNIMYGKGDFIDWKAGETFFDTPEFMQLLELSHRFPDDGYFENAIKDGTLISEQEAIATGRQLMMPTQIVGFYDGFNNMMFGGEIVYKGFPTANRDGNIVEPYNSLAIVDKSPNKDAAWTFVRTVLDKDKQLDGLAGGFASNHDVFNQQISNVLEPNYFGEMIIDDVTYRAPTTEEIQASIDLILALINSGTLSAVQSRSYDEALLDIIKDGLAGYYSGVSSAQDAVRVIQSRASILVSERS